MEQTIVAQDAWELVRTNAFRIAREQWIGFAIVAAIALAADLMVGRECNLAGFAFYPAVASAVRIVYPDFQLNGARIIAMLGLGFCVAIIIGVPGIAALIVSREIPALRGPVLTVVFLCCIWLYVKLSLNQVLYALTLESRPRLLNAIRLSWVIVRGNTWWRLFVAIVILVIGSTLAAIPIGALGFWLSVLSPELGHVVLFATTVLLGIIFQIVASLFFVGFALEQLTKLESRSSLSI